MPEHVYIRWHDFTFVFSTEPTDPEMLHIYARHLVFPDDVFDLWEDPETTDVWNEDHQRYESRNRTHTLYWNWTRDYDILVMSCFRNEEEA